mgnify:CR=1 FL=1
MKIIANVALFKDLVAKGDKEVAHSHRVLPIINGKLHLSLRTESNEKKPDLRRCFQEVVPRDVIEEPHFATEEVVCLIRGDGIIHSERVYVGISVLRHGKHVISMDASVGKRMLCSLKLLL